MDYRKISKEKVIDVGNEYKKEIKGKIIIPKKYQNDKKHKDEREAMFIINETLGGNIELFQESNIPTADFIWNNKFWEHKNISGELSLDKAIRKGLKQIYKNPGGLILNIDKSSLNDFQIAYGIIDRLKQTKFESLDVIFIKNNKIQKIRRYKK